MGEATVKILYNLGDETMVKSSPLIRIFALCHEKHILALTSSFGLRANRPRPRALGLGFCSPVLTAPGACQRLDI